MHSPFFVDPVAAMAQEAKCVASEHEIRRIVRTLQLLRLFCESLCVAEINHRFSSLDLNVPAPYARAMASAFLAQVRVPD